MSQMLLRSNTLIANRSPISNVRKGRPATVRVQAAVNKDQLKGAYNELKSYITSKHCNPIVVRLAWHDAGTYDKNVKEWPSCGGANASIRFTPELGHGANAGLKNAVDLLEPIKQKFPEVSYADIYQMASAVAVEMAGGPKMPVKYGRMDVVDEKGCVKEGNLPDAAHPFPDGSASPAQHLRRIFHRMGLNDQEIVVLSGGHTLGRVKKDRSGFGVEETKYTKDGPGSKGGTSWTPDWLTFNNSYFVETIAKRDSELVVLPTDACIYEDEGFRPHTERYAADQDAFFKDYTNAFIKLSELGAKWDEGAPVMLD